MKRLSCVGVAILGIIPCVARSASADEIVPLVCAVVDLASCAPGAECQRETAGGVNAPELVIVDLKLQQITGKRPNGELLSTQIERMTRSENLLVLEGVQDALSWTMTVTDDTGQMSLGVVGSGVAFAAFGRCMPK